jgi:hypothetical protein
MPTRQKNNRDLIRFMSHEDRQRTARSLCRQPWVKEKDFQKLCESMLKLAGIWHIHLNNEAAKFLRPGIPDLIICIQGQFLALELKADKGWVRPAQRKEMDWIQSSGGEAWVIKSVQDLYAVLDGRGVWQGLKDRVDP